MTARKPTVSEPWVDPDDAPLLTREFFEQAEWRIGETVIRRGRPPTGAAKQVVSLRMERELLAALRAMGPGWQTRATDALREMVAADASRLATPPKKGVLKSRA